jgi:hypothetical protein
MRNANVHPYRQIRAPEEVKRIREAERIDRENRIIADRLRNRVNYICVCFVLFVALIYVHFLFLLSLMSISATYGIS